jgi:hypothetical protein
VGEVSTKHSLAIRTAGWESQERFDLLTELHKQPEILAPIDANCRCASVRDGAGGYGVS